MPRGYIAGGSKYLKPYSSVEHVNGNVAFAISLIFVIFICYVIYRVRKQIREDEEYLIKKRELIGKLSRKATDKTKQVVNKLRKK